MDKMLSRRNFVQIAAGATAGVVLAACQPQTVEVEKIVTQVVKETVEVEKEVEKVVKETVVVEKASEGPAYIRLTTWYGEGDIELWDKVNTAFMEAYPEIKVAFEPLAWGQYWQKLQTGMAAGDTPDVAGMGIETPEYSARKQIRTLEPYVEKDGWDRTEMFEGLLFFDTWPRQGGDLYALPYSFTGGGTFVNKTLFEAAGVPLPEKGWTWPTDFQDIGQKLTNTAEGVYGANIPPGQIMTPYMAGNDTMPLTEDVRKSNWLDPKVKETLEFWRQNVCELGICPKPDDVTGMGDLFMSGKIAISSAGLWMIAAYRKITDFEWDVVYNPVKEGVNKMALYGGPDSLCLPTAGKDPDNGWTFLKYACAHEDAQTIMAARGFPTTVALANSPEIINAQAELGPANFAALIEQANYIYGWSFGPGWAEWNGYQGQVMGEVYNCRMDLDEALPDIDAEVNKILDRAYEAIGLE
ncbi:MAG: extracellular solute-binding protein [Anaerolineae bacterium]